MEMSLPTIPVYFKLLILLICYVLMAVSVISFKKRDDWFTSITTNNDEASFRSSRPKRLMERVTNTSRM
jgi:hypothetical protein